MQKRYLKNYKTISEEEQTILFRKKISIVGCGGLGQYIASQLCRIGIGALNIIDDDIFDETNLNRQQYCHTQNIGKAKIFETEKQLKLINPDTKITAYKIRFTSENAYDLLANSDLVIDALDSVKDRLILQEACNRLNLPIISGAIGGWYGQLTLVMPGDNTLSQIYTDSEQKGVETELGNPAFTPALMASLQVSESVKFLLNKTTLSNKKILYIDLLNLDFDFFSLS